MGTAPTALALTGLALLGGSAWLGTTPSAAPQPPLSGEVADVRQVAAAPLTTAPTTTVPPAAQPAVPAPAPALARPAALSIPSLDLEVDLVDLGLDAQRRLEVPEDPAQVGWWSGGPAPGADGAAVLAGHVDSYEGPGAFWRLGELTPGDRIEVTAADGTVHAFVVDGVGRWPKSEFPTDAVYRQADGPELRLITCGGPFDEADRSYRDNVIVFATAV
ncbi:class F sortase [Blastococcus montanus]|uniref:class F sortase n=1 Tax=Blastococcus montanus TaxID=3144973 RepID=UPI0032096B10